MRVRQLGADIAVKKKAFLSDALGLKLCSPPDANYGEGMLFVRFPIPRRR
jgi:hypothetical protein